MQITIKGHEIGEQAAMNKTLLDSAAGAQSLEGLHCGTLVIMSTIGSIPGATSGLGMVVR